MKKKWKYKKKNYDNKYQQTEEFKKKRQGDKHLQYMKEYRQIKIVCPGCNKLTSKSNFARHLKEFCKKI